MDDKKDRPKLNHSRFSYPQQNSFPFLLNERFVVLNFYKTAKFDLSKKTFWAAVKMI